MLCNLMYVHVGKPPPSNTSGRAQFKLGSDLESKRTISIRSGGKKLLQAVPAAWFLPLSSTVVLRFIVVLACFTCPAITVATVILRALDRVRERALAS